MRVLQISNYYYPHVGGIEQVAKDISQVLSNSHDVKQKIICFNENASDSTICDKRSEDSNYYFDGIEIIKCGCFAKIASQSISLSYYRKLKELLESFDPDIILFHYPNPFVACILLQLITDKTQLIVYWHLDITKQKLLGKLFHFQNIKLLERSDKIVATSPNYIDGSKYLSKYKNKCYVIPNCVSINSNKISNYSINKSKEIRNKYKNKFICFTVGRHIPYKGFEYLIKTSKLLNDDYKILIGGTGPLTKKLKRMIKNNKIVELLGFLNEEDLIAYYLACDAITFSSITKNEAFGISLAEGMSFGKPAVTYNIKGSGVNYVNINKITGIECENKNIYDYAEAIKYLYNNIDIKNKYGESAKYRVLNNFTYNIFKNNIEKLLSL